MKKLTKRLSKIWAYMVFIEEQRIKAAIHTASAGPLM